MVSVIGTVMKHGCLIVSKKDRDEGRGAVASNTHCGLGRKGRRGVAEQPQAGPRPWRSDVTP